MTSTQRLRLSYSGDILNGGVELEPGILNERILLLVFEHMKWDLTTLCVAARVNRKLRAVAKRILWRELCMFRAPRMVRSLVTGLPGSRIGGGWHALAKLLFFCCGCQSTRNFKLENNLSGHFLKAARFSKTSGKSFLTKKGREDLLYVSDPCEHTLAESPDDLGVYRGVFMGFMRSKTRACLIGRQVQLEEHVRCPYCGARVWSMTTAKLIPKSAARRLGTHDGGLEYFVCINGHLHGACWLVPLSSDEEGRGRLLEDDEEEEEDEEDGTDLGENHVNGEKEFREYDSTSSAGDDHIVLRDFTTVFN